jgi:long-chain fatty acid transport protein
MYTFGMAYRLSHDLLISGEITYNQWSDFLSPSLEIHTDINVPIIPIHLLPGVVEDPHFSDTWTPRIGVEYRGITKKSYNIVFRTGYAYDPSPVPEQTGWSNFLDGNKHIFSTGLGLELKELFGKDLSNACPALQGVFQYQWIQKTHHQKLPSVNPINPGFPTITGEGEVFFFGLALTVEYGGT